MYYLNTSLILIIIITYPTMNKYSLKDHFYVFRSPLLNISHLVYFPWLNDMLKFSQYSLYSQDKDNRIIIYIIILIKYNIK